MKPFYKDYKLYIALAILLLLPITILFPEFSGNFDRTLDVPADETGYRGLRLNDMRSGDKVDISYRSNADLRMYLLTREEADHFRSITFEEKILGKPITSGYRGEENIEIDEEGDYEMVFWNDTFPLGTQVECKGQIHRQRDVNISRISTISLCLISLLIISFMAVQRIRNR